MQNNHLSSKSSSIKQEIKRGPAIHYMPYLHQRTGMGWQSRLTALLAAATLTLSIWLPALAANQIDIVGPPGSGSFGASITVLTNGNFVVTDLNYDIPGGATDVGAVYLYDGSTHNLISTMTGSTSGDQVGYWGVTALSNGNYVVVSIYWDNGSATDAGAVTWCNGNTGVSGEVSSSNSLVGSTSDDLIGYSGITALSNGNYLVNSRYWDNGNAIDAGAVTWGDGSIGVSGKVSNSNSLIGSTYGDRVGGDGLAVLSNDNYLVFSSDWDNGSAIDAGAVTWGSGTSGIHGEVNSSNSLVGSTSDDWIGDSGATLLSNGNYLVTSPYWDNGSAVNLGAVTWGNGSTGVSGEVNSSNSLIGSPSGGGVGNVYVLSNDNYVVVSSSWDNGGVTDVGAVTWGSGVSGVSGEISSSNSLVGNTSGDSVGAYGVAALSNGNYVVISPYWDNGSVSDAGAVTWVDGTNSVKGDVNSSNSLVGSTKDDLVGIFRVVELSNGNYVVRSPGWDNGNVIGAGAVTWGSGTSGVMGEVSSNNSLVGSTNDDWVGDWVVTALNNGNYVMHIPHWDSGSATDAGAVTWGNGTDGTSGTVSSNNSLVGSTSGDQVGIYEVTVLNNGNYVVRIPDWDNGSVTDVGAVAWGNGSSGSNGAVSSNNSLVGSISGDQVGIHGVAALKNGNYVVFSPYWDNGGVVDGGAVTWGNGNIGSNGAVSSSNSFVGNTGSDFIDMSVVPLSNGNYVLINPGWNSDSTIDVGAVTWVDGTTGANGEMSNNNSLTGSKSGDQVGISGVMALVNGNYLVRSPYWDNGNAIDSGAVTWGSGTGGISGEVSSSNSLVGSTNLDRVGVDSMIKLSNGNYLVLSPDWDNGSATDAGAITWGSGISGISGEVSSSNSLVGSSSFDQVGYPGEIELINGNYMVISRSWDNGNVSDAGAVTWGDGRTGVSGLIDSSNSIVGMVTNGGLSTNFSYNTVYGQLLVGRPAENIVTLFDVSEKPIGNARVYLPALSR